MEKKRFQLPLPSREQFNGASHWLLDRWRDLLQGRIWGLESAVAECCGAMRQLAYGSGEGNSDGTSEVVLVSPPPPGVVRKVTNIRVANVDTATAVINLAKQKDGTNYHFVDESLGAADEWTLPDCEYLILDEEDESLVLFLDGAVTTNELDFNVAWEDYQAR